MAEKKTIPTYWLSMDHRRRVWNTLYSDFQIFSLILQDKTHTGQVREQNDVEISLLNSADGLYDA